MAEASDGAGLARFVDNYIEEVAVGTPWWVLVLAFGLGMPALFWAAGLILQLRYQPGSYGIALFVGVVIALGLRLIARERERYRASTVDRAGDLQAIRRLSWTDFEIAVGEVVRRQGYTVKERGGFHADGGIDLIAEGGKGRIAIQCKHWKVWSVNAPRVRELYGVVKGGGFVEGWLVTCGVFSPPARSWARGKELRLIDGRELAGLVQGTSFARPALNAASVSLHPLPAQAIECPNCGGELRQLTNTNDGSQFWGCNEQTCGWTFDAPPAAPGKVLCDRGHQMVLRRTKRGIAFWGCSTYPSCKRKRLVVVPFVGP
jgi:restriction system protein